MRLTNIRVVEDEGILYLVEDNRVCPLPDVGHYGYLPTDEAAAFVALIEKEADHAS